MVQKTPEPEQSPNPAHQIMAEMLKSDSTDLQRVEVAAAAVMAAAVQVEDNGLRTRLLRKAAGLYEVAFDYEVDPDSIPEGSDDD